VGRVASFYYWGIARGYGFRDTAQDTIAITFAHPEKAKERVKLLARQMFKDGRVYHHFYGDVQGETTDHCDDPVWFILAVTDYIKETGDFAILNHKENFVDTQDTFSIYDHLLALKQLLKTIWEVMAYHYLVVVTGTILLITFAKKTAAKVFGVRRSTSPL